MKTVTNILLLVIAVLISGCYQPRDSRIHLREEIRSDSLGSNIVTRPVTHAFSALTGEGLEITQAVTRRNDTGFLELYVDGFNSSYKTKRFRYRVEWLDEDGLLIQSKTSVWMPASAMGKSSFSLKAVAPTPKVANFRMDTRKWE